MDTIDILIPVYNAGPYLADTIRSVLAQTYPHWTLTIVDDCSTDNSYAVAETFAGTDERIKLVKNERNLGMLGNWNYGISLCQSTYFVKLDADDIWHSQMLEKAKAVLDAHPAVGLVFSRYINIDEQGRDIAGSDVPLPAFAADKAFSCIPLVQQGPNKMLGQAILRQGLSVMRRAIFDKIGPYRHLLTKDTQASTDTEFYFRLGAHYDIYCIDKVLYQYRVHGSSISATDKASNLSDQKLYEIKHCIVDYYMKQGILPEKEGKQMLEQIETLYNIQQTAFYKNNGNKARAFSIITRRMLKSPGAVMNFYVNRVIQKITNRG